VVERVAGVVGGLELLVGGVTAARQERYPEYIRGLPSTTPRVSSAARGEARYSSLEISRRASISNMVGGRMSSNGALRKASQRKSYLGSRRR